MTVQEALLRLRAWWVGILVVVALVAYLAPQQVQVLVYKVTQIVLAVPLSYAVDRTLFRYAPAIDARMTHSEVGAARLIARALVATAVVLGLTLGI